jgi:hypothetical protein
MFAHPAYLSSLPHFSPTFFLHLRTIIGSQWGIKFLAHLNTSPEYMDQCSEVFGESPERRVRVSGGALDSRRSRCSSTICHLSTLLSSSVRSLSDIDRTLVSTADEMYGTTPRNLGNAVMAFGSCFSTVVGSEIEGVQVSLRGVSWKKCDGGILRYISYSFATFATSRSMSARLHLPANTLLGWWGVDA